MFMDVGFEIDGLLIVFWVFDFVWVWGFLKDYIDNIINIKEVKFLVFSRI